jgi:cytochrome c biogenesis protein CcmG/thiol:disulfide interchange protein DsbE
MQDSAPTADNSSPPTREPRRSLLIVLPVMIFSTIAVLFAVALTRGDPSKLPSALIGKQAPQLALPPLDGLVAGGLPVPGWSGADLTRGEPVLINFFASWCVPCAVEHPNLMQLRTDTGVRILGVNYKDPPPGGRRFLGRYGNPYAAVGVDADGRAAIEWGVYGMPESFVIDGAGRVVLKHVGPITQDALTKTIEPAIVAAGNGSSNRQPP